MNYQDKVKRKMWFILLVNKKQILNKIENKFSQSPLFRYILLSLLFFDKNKI
jgi:hypothetical protein